MRRIEANTSKRAAKEILSDVCAKWNCSIRDLKDVTRSPMLDRAKKDAYYKLRTELEWNDGRIGSYMGNKTRQAITKALLNYTPHTRLSAEEEIDSLRLQIKRLTGQNTSYLLKDKVDLPIWQCIPIAILIEAYPRVKTREQICELYGYAMAEATGDRSKEDGASLSVLKSAISQGRRAVLEHGLPDPYKILSPSGVKLSEEFAEWSACNIGRPRLGNLT